MDHFNYQNKRLYGEDVPIADIAKRYGTPVYVYSRATFERHWHAFHDALGEQPHLICYSVKANSNLAVLNILAQMGSGFDVVSIGELKRVIAAGGDPKKVVFSGVGKRADEIAFALEQSIYCFNVESAEELESIQAIAKRMNKRASIALRVNPDVDVDSHPYVTTGKKDTKFGVDISEAKQLYSVAKCMDSIEILGVDCHIGSQITELSPFLEALDRLIHLLDELKQTDIMIRHLNLGGGLGVRYKEEQPPHPSEYAKAIFEKLHNHKTLKLILEPGRAIAANAGILVTQVHYLKHYHHKNFAIVDAAMNDFARPALYQAWHDIIPVNDHNHAPKKNYDVVGPVCETGDFLGKDRSFHLQVGDLLAVRSAGAYGSVMSSQYNTRPRAPEVMIDGDQFHLVRQRETCEALFELESILPKKHQ